MNYLIIYEEYKIFLLKQLRMNSVTNDIYKSFLFKHKSGIKLSRSYFNILTNTRDQYNFEINNINLKCP